MHLQENPAQTIGEKNNSSPHPHHFSNGLPVITHNGVVVVVVAFRTPLTIA